mgnify:CR=1 FL=1
MKVKMSIASFLKPAYPKGLNITLHNWHISTYIFENQDVSD